MIRNGLLFNCRSLDSSHSITSPQSSSHSSQDSLHRGQHQQQLLQSPQIGISSRGKKKGIKSSLGRIFSKKDKTRKELYLASGRPEMSTDTDLRLPPTDSKSAL